MKKHLHVIQSIVPGSIAEEMELQPGDTVLAINGQDIEDVFDYHYLVNDEYIEIPVFIKAQYSYSRIEARIVLKLYKYIKTHF